MKSLKNDAGFITLAVRLVIGWTYFSAFWRRTVLIDKLNPDETGYIGEKFNHFLPNALGIKPIIQYLVENPDVLWLNMVIFTIIEGIVGLFIMLGFFTRLMSIGVFALALGILLGSGWIGTTCLDEWQIGILGIATGFVLFLTGSGKYSIDRFFINREFGFTKKNWFYWLGSGSLPMKESFFGKFVVIGSIFILGMTLMTNQVFHGGLWGPLHNKSVKPKLEISNSKINNEVIHFDLYRTEGVDVYGSWVIEIALFDNKNHKVISYGQNELVALEKEHISNYYIAKIKPGKHSLIVPLGAKAKVNLYNNKLNKLKRGTYLLRITDISGAFWEVKIFKD